jgi:Uma2 family endonuclease
MSTALRPRMTLEEFLTWESRQEQKWEFDGFAPVAMTGGSLGHGRIQARLLRALGNRLEGTRCYVVGSEVRVLAAGSSRYPDAFILCTPKPNRVYEVDDPVVVFEILSPSTSRTDRIVKVREYGATPSIRRYVLLEQDSIAATVFERRGGDWTAHVLTAEDTLAMPEVEVSLALAELYEGLDLSEAGSEPG